MSTAEPTTEAQETTIMERAVSSTVLTERDYAQQMLKTLTEQAMEGVVTWNKSVTTTIQDAIDRMDAQISKQLAAVMHHEDFQKIEGTYRGLHFLVMNTETSDNLKIKVLNVSKKELLKDLEGALEFDQSQMFKEIYEAEFGSPGGEPYGVLIGDFTFENHPDDMTILHKMSGVASAAFAPFIAAASPSLAGLERWTDLSKPRDLAKVFESAEFVKWRGFRDHDDSRFVALTMPRVLSRLPYGANTKPIDEFHFEEVELNEIGKHARPVDHSDYTWMNAAFVLGTRLTHAFARYGWCTRSRGFEGGGKVENLPAHVFMSDDGDLDIKCPTEIGITDRREAELSRLGFIPLSHYKKTDYAVFFGAQTCQKALKYDRPEATANAAISARLPYILATSRIAHYLKVIGRDKIGSFMELDDCQAWLERWIANYVSADAHPSSEAKARFPLAAAKIVVQEVPGAPGSYQAIAWLRPFLQLEELTASLRLVARIPVLS